MSELESPKPDEKWRIEDAVNTLIRAEEIKADKELMEKVKPLLSDKMRAMQKISSFKDLRDVAAKKIKEDVNGDKA